MIKLFKNLKKYYTIAYFTNMAKEYFEIFSKSQYPEKYFDYGLASYMVKARKTKKIGFEKLFKYFNLDSSEFLFIDDDKKYLKLAKKIGMKTIHFKNINKLKIDLKRKDISF